MKNRSVCRLTFAVFICIFTCMVNAGNTWISFIDEVAHSSSVITNRVYYAGTTNGRHCVVHETDSGNKVWSFEDVKVIRGVRRPFDWDRKRWVLLKDDHDARLRHWDVVAATKDFVARLPTESALVKPHQEWYSLARGDQCKSLRLTFCREYIVAATRSRVVHEGDSLCVGWLVDDHTVTTNILSRYVLDSRRTVQESRLLYLSLDDAGLVRDKIDGSIFVNDAYAVPIQMVWDADLYHETMIPFDEKKVIEEYRASARKIKEK